VGASEAYALCVSCNVVLNFARTLQFLPYAFPRSKFLPESFILVSFGFLTYNLAASFDANTVTAPEFEIMLSVLQLADPLLFCLIQHSSFGFISINLAVPHSPKIRQFHKMGGPSGNQLTLAKALEIAKENQNGQIPPAVNTLLERSISDTWRRIQAQPNTYIMTKDQFAVFTYYRARYDNNSVAQHAVARFWNHYKGDSTVDGARSTSSASSNPGSSSRSHGSSSTRTPFSR